eukprot:3531476-Heterocapsa_arctica.AAC.1
MPFSCATSTAGGWKPWDQPLRTLHLATIRTMRSPTSTLSPSTTLWTVSPKPSCTSHRCATTCVRSPPAAETLSVHETLALGYPAKPRSSGSCTRTAATGLAV